MHPVIDEGKLAYIDCDGDIVLKTAFDSGGKFHNDRANVWRGKKVGFLNSKGETVIPPHYDSADRFTGEGYCRVKVNGRWGLINRDNEFVIKPVYKNMGNCVCGIVGLEIDSESPISYIDIKSMKEICRSNYPGIREFSNGLLACDDTGSGLYGYVDTGGEWRIAPAYSFTRTFSEGLGAVDSAGKKIKTGFINSRGEIVITCKFKTGPGAGFRCGRAVVWQTKRDTTIAGVIDTSGELTVDYKFAFIDNYSEGLAAAAEERNPDLYGYIDAKGDYVLQPSFESARPFSDGLAYVHGKTHEGYINTAGDFVWRKKTEG
jgi:hypothetical protein